MNADMARIGEPDAKPYESLPWKNHCRFCAGTAKGLSLTAGIMPFHRRGTGDWAQQHT